ncbi:capsid protein [Chicken picobirnavirus]|uniref:capsid protein n=1 Tax=Chicken picobirnavirus TaxID=1930304 RepID=UPI000EB7080D|nr:capsid protein [Chicken picobirnavirus]AXY55126.1 capsid protein [Chicken picobirnavirus]
MRKGKNQGHSNKSTSTEKNRTSGGKYQRQQKDSECEEKKIPDGKGNHVSWYTANPQMVKDACSIPFAERLGTEVSTFNTDTYVFPGIMAYDWIPTVGTAVNATDPINVAALKLYTYIRHAKSGSPTYDAPDLANYFIAVDSLINFWATVRRAYGVLMWNSVYNVYMRQYVFEAMGFDYDYFVSHIADFRNFINYMAHQINAVPIVKDLGWYARHRMLNDYVYADSQSTQRAQVFMARQRYYWLFNEHVAGSPARFDLTRMPDKFTTIEQLREFFVSLANPVLGSESMGVIYSDLLRVYGTERLEILPMVDESYVTLPLFDPAIMEQFRNCVTPLPWTGCDFSGLMTTDADTNAIVSRIQILQVPAKYKTFDHDYLYYARVDMPTPEEVMVGTRWMAVWEHSDDTTLDLVSCGCDVPISMHIYTLHYTGGGQPTLKNETLYSDAFVDFTNDDAQGLERFVNGLISMSPFNEHPRRYIWLSDNYAAVAKPMGMCDNYTVVEPRSLTQMHTIAMLGAFDLKETVRPYGR